MGDDKTFCEHEGTLRQEGWVPEIVITVWAKKGEEERQIHYHGPNTIMDYASLIRYLTENLIELEDKRENHE